MEAIAQANAKETIYSFISKSINIHNISADEDLFDSGIVNSLFSIQLITFIEKTFDIRITSDDLDMDNFKSVNAVYNFVLRKQAI